MSLLDDVRDWVGSEPADDVVLGVLDRYVASTFQAQRAALAILRVRRADLDTDRSFAVSGDASWGAVAVENVKRLDAKITRLEAVTGDVAPDLNPLSGVDLQHRSASSVRRR